MKRTLTSREVLRLSALCFLAHWTQDVLFPFLYKWKTSGDFDFDPVVKVVTVATAFLLTWGALALVNSLWGIKYETSPPVA
jgi:hypothetical protein